MLLDLGQQTQENEKRGKMRKGTGSEKWACDWRKGKKVKVRVT